MTTQEFDLAVSVQRDSWIPACGGHEKPFRSRSGRTLLYCYNPGQDRHAYLDVATDTILSDEDAKALLW
jgi:hypothetical protein